jgi:hypothetical protein
MRQEDLMDRLPERQRLCERALGSARMGTSLSLEVGRNRRLEDPRSRRPGREVGVAVEELLGSV